MFFANRKDEIDKKAKALLANGDIDFENKYFTLKSGDILTHIIKFAPSSEDAEEIVITSYQSLLKQLKKAGSNIENLDAYWKRIAKNMCHKLRDKSTKDPLYRSVDVDEAFFLADIDPQSKLETRERMEIVHRCINSLGDRCKKVISMYYLLELPYQKISEELDEKEPTIRQWRFRCMRELRLLTQQAGLHE